MTIFENPGAAMAGAYPSSPFRIRHRFADDPRFTLEALLKLATRLPPDSIEYNAGDIPIDQDPDKTPMTGLSIAETIRRIEECNSWMVIRHVEQDAEYKAALEECLAEIAPHAEPSTGKMHQKVGFIFISSADATTPMHLDPEHNILVHLKGSKKMTIYRTDKGVISDEHHERYHVGEAHRNLNHRPEFDAFAETFDLEPGDGVYVPVKAPHWVKTGPAPCISFSITWRSRASDSEARLRIANHRIRAWGGNPPTPGAHPARDAAVTLAQRVVYKMKHPFG
jgi:mannose-6-phosphate isomerase-like protein (cupin superfamily)